jgi:hypothetical protein
LIVVQEMAARKLDYRQRAVGCIREGLRATFITMAILAIGGFGNIAAGSLASHPAWSLRRQQYFAVPVGRRWCGSSSSKAVTNRWNDDDLVPLIWLYVSGLGVLSQTDWKMALHDTLITIPWRFAIPADDC